MLTSAMTFGNTNISFTLTGFRNTVSGYYTEELEMDLRGVPKIKMDISEIDSISLVHKTSTAKTLKRVMKSFIKVLPIEIKSLSNFELGYSRYCDKMLTKSEQNDLNEKLDMYKKELLFNYEQSRYIKVSAKSITIDLYIPKINVEYFGIYFRMTRNRGYSLSCSIKMQNSHGNDILATYVRDTGPVANIESVEIQIREWINRFQNDYGLNNDKVNNMNGGIKYILNIVKYDVEEIINRLNNGYSF